MKWLLRPSSVLILLGLFVVGAALWVYETTKLPSRPKPLNVAAQDREIIWLSAATASTSWQRFVQAVLELKIPGVVAGPATFPRLTTEVPELVIPLPNQKGKLRIRWYKLTSEYDAAYWMKEIMAPGRQPPLAIIGGNTTDAAVEQAKSLFASASRLPEEERPLLLLTTATADRVGRDTAVGEEAPLLTDLYPNRTFRFCFNNRQIGEAVVRFCWDQPELRPDAFPLYTSIWEDDSYSSDLIGGFVSAMQEHFVPVEAAAAASDLALAAGPSWASVFLAQENDENRESLSPFTTKIPWSIGSFERPNPYEVVAARRILDELDQHPRQQRPMLVLSGQSGPSRRLVRALCRLSPTQTRQFVLVAGDAISFSTVLRDRDVAWPIQDLPCSLVLFCHHNPLGVLPEGQERDLASGTDDLLLYQNIADALYVANARVEGMCRGPNDLRQQLFTLRRSKGRLTVEGEGPLLFDPSGNRRSGSGEHVVWLKPTFAGPRVLPEATLTVHAWSANRSAWVPRGEPLTVLYSGARLE